MLLYMHSLHLWKINYLIIHFVCMILAQSCESASKYIDVRKNVEWKSKTSWKKHLPEKVSASSFTKITSMFDYGPRASWIDDTKGRYNLPSEKSQCQFKFLNKAWTTIRDNSGHVQTRLPKYFTLRRRLMSASVSCHCLPHFCLSETETIQLSFFN